MSQLLVDRRDQQFVIWEQMNCEAILNHEAYRDFNKKTCELVIAEARTLAIKELLPLMAQGDRQGVRFEAGSVKVPDGFQQVFRLILDGEWNNLGVALEMGGQGAPAFLTAAVSEYFMGANWPLYCYATMGNGTARIIHLYGTPAQREKYVTKLTAAQWGGTMLLTEPGAGSDVGALTTTAQRNADGTYSLTGSKIFITNGECDLFDNIIHPVLARIEGDPPGTRGISLFLVPKYLVNDDGSLGQRNDIACTGVEAKHGIHASATCSMTLGGKGNCVGYLLGEERIGMKIMFNMINYARMSTGLQAMSYASAAYLLALNYARERIQGRDIKDFADHGAPSVAIINHPDVRRNLLWMKSYLNGMRSFFYYLTRCRARAMHADRAEQREQYDNLFSMLTPIVKDYLAVKGHDICIQALQVFGGAGYTQDYLVEQYARDCKITSIYEGTSGIQAMDLLARKIGMQKGAVFMNFLAEIQKSVAAGKNIPDLESMATQVEHAAKHLGETALGIGRRAMSADVKVAFAHALPFLYAMGDTVMAWMLLWRAVVASQKLVDGPGKKEVDFYQGQIHTADFYIHTELPLALARMDVVNSGCAAALSISDAGFGG